jgi:hypothetical protein
VLCIEKPVQLISGRGFIDMSASMRDTGGEALTGLLAASGVAVTANEAEAVARSLKRIDVATAALLQEVDFDETVERFYRLLEGDAGTGAGA